MSVLDSIIERARAAAQTIVLPEGNDPRILEAAARIAREDIAARLIVLVTPEEQARAHDQYPVGKLPVELLDYHNAPIREELTEQLFELRRHKGATTDWAKERIGDRLYFGSMMVREGMADGLVAGSTSSTPDMIRAAIRCIGPAPGIRTCSSCFIMELARPTPGKQPVLLFADAAVNPEPNPEQLADIAIATIQTHQTLLDGEARVALLSFSTRGSAKHSLVKKVSQATEYTRQRVAEAGLHAQVDGELQLDSAIVPSVAASKCKDSPLQGTANILIFPDLQSGNIGYKIAERLAGAHALGPILQGLNKPANDLSRGCSVDNIVGVAAITACQAAGST